MTDFKMESDINISTTKLQLDANSSTRPYFWEYELGRNLLLYPSIIIIIVGIVGNMLVLFVLVHKKPYSSTTIYLLNLAVADLIVIVIAPTLRSLPIALSDYDITKENVHMCHFWFFMNHTSKTMSRWTLVAIAVERVIVVYKPFKAKQICSPMAAKWTVFIINVLSFACYVHYFWTYGRVSHVLNNITVEIASCTVLKSNPTMEFYVTKVKPWQDFFLRAAAPFAILFVCNIVIVKTLISVSRERKQLRMTSNTGNVKTSLSGLLLALSTVYIICIAPLLIMFFIDDTWPFSRAVTTRSQAVASIRWAIAIDMDYTNHAVNFILYCLTSSEFRKDFKKYIWSKCTCDAPCSHTYTVHNDIEMRDLSSVSVVNIKHQLTWQKNVK